MILRYRRSFIPSHPLATKCFSSSSYGRRHIRQRTIWFARISLLLTSLALGLTVFAFRFGLLVSFSIAMTRESNITSNESVVVEQKTAESVRKVPVIDRSIFAKMDLAAELFPPDPEYDIFGKEVHDFVSARVENTWPPLITAIPEPNPYSSRNLAAHDSRFCGPGFRPCSFLLPLRIAEQESKARIHLAQLFLLAKSLGRTLVLPNVGQSRLGACAKYAFDTYYAVPNGFDVIDMESFRKWSGARPLPPTSQRIAISGRAQTNDVEDITLEYEDLTILRKTQTRDTDSRCLQSRYSKLTPDEQVYPGLIIFPTLENSSNTPAGFAESVIDILQDSGDLDFDSPTDDDERSLGQSDVELSGNVLRSSDSSIDDWSEDDGFPPADVIIVNYDLRYQLFPVSPDFPSVTLEYSSLLTKFVDLIPTPDLAIHWRMETVPTSSLGACADALADTVFSLLPPVSDSLANDPTVWLATDYPHALSPKLRDIFHEPVKTGTFRPSLEHTSAILRFRAAMTIINENINLMDLDTISIRDLEMHGNMKKLDYGIFEDVGVRGILDKLIATKAKIFISGSRECGRASSFTKQILDSREIQVRDGSSSLKNIVQLFGGLAASR